MGSNFSVARKVPFDNPRLSPGCRGDGASGLAANAGGLHDTVAWEMLGQVLLDLNGCDTHRGPGIAAENSVGPLVAPKEIAKSNHRHHYQHHGHSHHHHYHHHHTGVQMQVLLQLVQRTFCFLLAVAEPVAAHAPN